MLLNVILEARLEASFFPGFVVLSEGQDMRPPGKGQGRGGSGAYPGNAPMRQEYTWRDASPLQATLPPHTDTYSHLGVVQHRQFMFL